ncbi:ATP-binding protein [Pseudacidovorax sp. RU35E]|uniref:ATP-binding protein n=1 Tax=Pseudacidovorax sp. RU35E TaxID=1907403 RepID=UPI0009542642|nr:ATP-binding protein [Pseudacidovorax sp. RU35E]SIR77695.1 GAF domain-containing protein [Pseudacidovorax sp. RU35E]
MALLLETGDFCARADVTLAQCLDRWLAGAVQLAGADAALIQTFDASQERWGLLRSHGLPDSQAARLTALAGQEPGVAHALAKGCRIASRNTLRSDPAHVSDGGRLALSPRFRAELRRTGIRAWMALPLQQQGGLLMGVLVVGFAASRLPDADHTAPLRLLARQACDGLVRFSLEAELRQAEERVRVFASASLGADLVYRMSADWREMRHLQGRSMVPTGPGARQDWVDVYIPVDERARVRQAIQQAIAKGDAFELEHRVLRADGSAGRILSRAVPMRDASRRVVEWLGIASDAPERRLAEQALRASEGRYRSLFDSIDEGYCVIQLRIGKGGAPHDYVFLEINQAFERHTGISDAVGRSMRDISADMEEAWYELYARVALTGEPVRVQQAARSLARFFDVYAFRLGEPQLRQVAVLVNDITQRRAQEQALRDADRQKDEFLATLAHELRNPLAPMRAGLQAIQAADAAPGVVAGALPVLTRQLDHLVRLVDDLLELSRISGGQVELRRERADLRAVLEAAVETSRPLLSAMRHRLTVELADGPLWLDADPVRLAQVFANLLNNAAKYTDEGGEIGIGARREPGWAVVTVRDSGVGIAADMLTGIFERFIQVPATRHRAQGGRGIGLHLARSLVALHGGAIEARSAGLGQGSTFEVRLPLMGATGGGIAQPDLGPKTAPALPPARPIPADPAWRVLVVDDNADAADSLRLLLRVHGFEAQAAHTPESGLRAIEAQRPDVVVLDIGMPGMDGWEVAQFVRARYGPSRPLLVALSGWGREEDRLRSQQAGMDFHFTKPVDIEALRAVFEMLADRMAQPRPPAP